MAASTLKVSCQIARAKIRPKVKFNNVDEIHFFCNTVSHL
jgi:hypothetical protein